MRNLKIIVPGLISLGLLTACAEQSQLNQEQDIGQFFLNQLGSRQQALATAEDPSLYNNGRAQVAQNGVAQNQAAVLQPQMPTAPIQQFGAGQAQPFVGQIQPAIPQNPVFQQGTTAPILQPRTPEQVLAQQRQQRQQVASFGGPSIYGSIQPQYRLNDIQINQLFAGKTVFSTSVNDSQDRQIGYFSNDLALKVQARGQRLNGSWFAYQNQMCYDLGSPAICSSVYMMPPVSPGGTPTYFFVREQGPDAGKPSVIVTGIRDGNSAGF